MYTDLIIATTEELVDVAKRVGCRFEIGDLIGAFRNWKERKIIGMNEGDDDCLGMDGDTTADANGSILTAKEAEPTIKEIKNRLRLGIFWI